MQPSPGYGGGAPDRKTPSCHVDGPDRGGENALYAEIDRLRAERGKLTRALRWLYSLNKRAVSFDEWISEVVQQ